MKFIIHNESGDILRVVDCVPEMAALQAKPGELIMEGNAMPSKHKIVTENGVRVVAEKQAAPVVQTQRQIYNTYLAAGYEDAETGIKLKTTENAQAKFSQLATLLNIAMQSGAIQPTAIQTIFDYNEASHEMEASAIIALLLRYGFFCTNLFNNHAP